MAQTSGFFEAQWDEEAIDPTTGKPGYWDRNYLSEQFAKYFSTFIGNGVFANPVNQLKVIPGVGLTVIVKSGFAFINGYWYYNDEDLTLTVPANATTSPRTDSVKVRFSLLTRKIEALYFTSDITITRTANLYDLELAQIEVQPLAESISNSYITDTRSDENVCGFVKGLIELVDTEDLFLQYNQIFNDWFDTVKGQITGDLGTRLQTEFSELNQNVQTYYNNSQLILNQSQTLIDNYVNNDYVIGETTCVFTNKVCEILDNKITSASLIDVYFTAETIDNAVDAQIYVDSFNGGIRLTAEEDPAGTIVARFRVRIS